MIDVILPILGVALSYTIVKPKYNFLGNIVNVTMMAILIYSKYSDVTYGIGVIFLIIFVVLTIIDLIRGNT